MVRVKSDMKRDIVQVTAALTAGFLVGVTLTTPSMLNTNPVTPITPPTPPILQNNTRHGAPLTHSNTTTTTTTTTTASPTPDAAHLPARPPKMCYSTVAGRLQQQVKILCLVVTYPAHHTTHALPVYRTWSRRCSGVLFVTNNSTGDGQAEEGMQEGENSVYEEEEVKEMPFLTVPEADKAKESLWNKTKFAFTHAHDHYLDDYDWFLKADDDTFIVMENLRYWLHDKDPEEGLYYGSHFTFYAPKGYMSGGAGYVLSRGALKAFHRVTTTDKNTTYGEEDIQMGMVLAAAGVFPSDSRDSEGRPRFFPLDPGFMVEPRRKDKFWYWEMIPRNHPTGMQCCSPHTISFHYTTGPQMYELEFLIYHLKLFGVSEETASPC